MIATILALSLVLASDDPDGAIEPETLALFQVDHEAPLAIEELSSEELEGLRLVELTYAGAGGERVSATLFEPAGEGPNAGLLLLHGMPGDRGDVRRLGLAYARAGAVCLSIDAPWARLETPRESVLTFTETDRAEQVQLIGDLRRGVDLLSSLPWVDPDRLGYVGGSYGGAMGGLFAALEPRLAVAVLMIGDGGLVAHCTGADDEVPPPGVAEDQWQAWLDAMRPIEPSRFIARERTSQLLFQNGRTDEFVPRADAEAYHAAASEPKTVLWYDSGHALTREMLRDQARWLAEELGTRADAFD